MSDLELSSAAERKAFDMAFANWLENATDEELEQYEELQSTFVSIGIGANRRFVTACLSVQSHRANLPIGLVERLKAANWPPVCVSAKAL